ncbi:hypothetical protein V8B97DRAFT_1916879 [Scleroderma yunnanense]
MSRCLFLYEITSHIFTFVRQLDEKPPDDVEPIIRDQAIGRRTLASLARTCRAFHKPAVAILWAKLDNLDPLIKLLPRGAWTERRWRIPRKRIKERHWLTFCKYASHVRSLGVPDTTIYGLSQYNATTAHALSQYNAITALARYTKAEFPLLPNLTHLVWTDRPTAPTLKYLVGERVTDVTLFVFWPPQDSPDVAILSELSTLCPNVSTLALFVPPTFSQQVAAIVQRWPKLRSFSSLALPQTVMDQLTSRRGLESLSIELDNTASPVYIGSLPATLRTFSLDGGSAGRYVRYLHKAYGFPESFTLKVYVDGSTTEDIMELLCMLPEHLDQTALRELSIKLVTSSSPELPRTFPLELQALSPLFTFRSLRIVDLDTFDSGELDDTAFSDIARSWPAITHFAFGTGSVKPCTKPRATVNALIVLLTYCRNLASLHLAFDGTATPPVELPATTMNMRITRLQVGYSPIRDVAAISRCFARLMPKLRKITAYRFSVEHYGRWAAVQGML